MKSNAIHRGAIIHFSNKTISVSIIGTLFFSALLFFFFMQTSSFSFLNDSYFRVNDERNFDFEYWGEDGFFEYYFLNVRPKHNNRVRWSLKNKRDRSLWIENIKVKYFCNDGFSDLKVHYFSKAFMPGEMSPSIGVDSVCENYKGFHKYEVTGVDWKMK